VNYALIDKDSVTHAESNPEKEPVIPKQNSYEENKKEEGEE